MARPHRLANLGKFGPDHPNFKTGRWLTRDGYVMVLVGDHPFKRKGRYMAEHVKIVEQLLERRVKTTEEVHHLNHIRDDNRPDNLEVRDKSAHKAYHNRMRAMKPHYVE